MKKICLWMIMFSCAFSAFAQTPAEPQRISPDSAVEMAIRNNLNLEAARIGLDIKRRKTNLVWNQFLPNATLAGTLAHDNFATKSEGVIGSMPYSITLPQWHVNGLFSATLDFSFALFAGIKSFRLDYEAGLVSLDKARLQIEQGVRKIYNNILLLEANLELLNESYSNAQRQSAIAEANFRAGLIPRLTWLQAQVGVQNMRPAVTDLENTLKTLKGNFALLIGLPLDSSFELESPVFEESDIPMDMSELISRAVTRKPDILELQAAITTLQSQKKALSLQQLTPFIRLGWDISYLFNPLLDPFKDNLFTGSNWKGSGTFSVTLGLSLNTLFPFAKEGQQRKDMDAAIQIQNIMLAQKILETELEVHTKLASLENIMSNIEVQRSSVGLAEQSYRLTEEAYRAGLQDYQAVQSSGLALDQAKLQLLTQRFNYLNDLIDLEYSIGVPFGTLSSTETPDSNGSSK